MVPVHNLPWHFCQALPECVWFFRRLSFAKYNSKPITIFFLGVRNCLGIELMIKAESGEICLLAS